MSNELVKKYLQQSALTVTLRLIAKLKKLRPIPVCAKCNKPVDEFTLEASVFCPDDCYFEFTAFCHGSTQKMFIHKGFFMTADEVTVNKAFETDFSQYVDDEGNLLSEGDYGDGFSKRENRKGMEQVQAKGDHFVRA